MSERPEEGRWKRLLWLAPAALLLLAAAGVVGYLVGSGEREAAEAANVQEIIQEQFALGLVDLEEGRYGLARQRFEYVIELDPAFPEAPQRLADALLGLNEPVELPTAPSPTATPNTAPAEEILTQAQTAFAAGDWDATINHLLTLRQRDPEFNSVDVDGLLYAALRNRGIRRLSREQLLEEGIYDLSLAESFAPLDEDASNWRAWAQLYLTANSFFGLNWEQAAFYFEVAYNVAPGIRNDVTWKYGHSLRMYAMQLATGGDPCAAEEVLDVSLEVLFNEELEPTATEVRNICRTATAPAPAAPPPTVEGTPDGEQTPEPTETPEA